MASKLLDAARRLLRFSHGRGVSCLAAPTVSAKYPPSVSLQPLWLLDFCRSSTASSLSRLQKRSDVTGPIQQTPKLDPRSDSRLPCRGQGTPPWPTARGSPVRAGHVESKDTSFSSDCWGCGFSSFKRSACRWRVCNVNVVVSDLSSKHALLGRFEQRRLSPPCGGVLK